MKYYIRLDDASENMDLENWKKVEQILDKWGVKPLFGIIPSNREGLPQNKQTAQKTPCVGNIEF